MIGFLSKEQKAALVALRLAAEHEKETSAVAYALVRVCEAFGIREG